MSRLRIPAFARRGFSAASRLSEGIPVVFVAVLAAVVLVAILYTIAAREQKEPRGYAEFTATQAGCVIDPLHQLNATGCERLPSGAYRVTFSKSLNGSTVVASRGSCCPGPVGASADTDMTVLVALQRRLRQAIRVTVLAP